MSKVLIIGAGPAGLTAAYELLSKHEGYEVIILEESNDLGGIARTVNYKGNRMDMGGHRFFSKVACSYARAVFHKRPETNLENFYINRFGKKLYTMFFEYYTENLW